MIKDTPYLPFKSHLLILILLCTLLVTLGCETAETSPTGGSSSDRGDAAMPMSYDMAGPSEADADINPARFQPVAPRLRRLSNHQYRHFLLDNFNLSLPSTTDLPAENQLHGFRSIAAAIFSLSLAEVESYETTSYAVSKAFFSSEELRQEFADCDLSEVSCIRSFIERVGKLLWRHPLTEDRITVLIDLWNQLTERPFSHVERAEFVLSSLLQSPDFLFIIEHGEPDPITQGRRRKTSIELLTAMTILIWDSPPSEPLIARYGDRMYDNGVEDEVFEILINDPRAARGLVGFFEEYLQIDRLDTLEKSRSHFILMSDTLAQAMKTEVKGMIENVVFTPNADIRAFLTTKETYLNEELAQLYNEPAPDGFSAHTYQEDSPRMGYLTTAAFLSLNAHNTVTSPTYRGKYVQNRFFCFDIPPPPEGIDTTLDAPEPGVQTTMRMRVAQHNNDPVCSGCHQFMDPIGLAFENFDAIGVWRTDENGLPIDPSGQIGGISFRDHRELIAHLASETEFAECVTRQFVRFAWSRLESVNDEANLAQLNQIFEDSGFNFLALVRAVVANEAFKALSEVTSE